MAEIHPFYETYRGGCGNGAMVEPLRHRQTKGAATDMFYLTPPRHISTLPIASLWQRADHFRSSPNSGLGVALRQLTLCAITGLLHRSQLGSYSITSSALASSVGGTLRPSAFAVLRLMINSNLVGSTTGRSAGLAPARTRPA